MFTHLFCPLPTLPCTLATMYLSVSMQLPILDISYKRKHMLMWPFCLLSFTYYNVFKVYSCRTACQHIILFDYRVTLYCVDGPHFVGGKCLGCFHFLAVMDNVALIIHIQVFVWKYIYNSLGHCGYVLRKESTVH